MKETLELNHIKGYLDHGLKCEILNYQCDYVGEQYGTVKGYYFLGDTIHYMFKDKSTAGKDASLFMPLLHPLSKLNETIEHNGESVCVMDLLMCIEMRCDESELEVTVRKTGDTYAYVDFNYDFDGSDYRLYYDFTQMTFQKGRIHPNKHEQIYRSYELHETLCKYHFDIHGLIQKGLAKEK